MKNCYKISFTGDVTCDNPLLNAAKANNEYHFDEPFEHLSCLLSDSDYVVANLETLFAKGEYNGKKYHYNSPTAFLDELTTIPVSLFTLANNHCLDMGIDGLYQTVLNLQDKNIDYTGVLHLPTEKKYKSIQTPYGVISFISLTQQINDIYTLKKSEYWRINMMNCYNQSIRHKAVQKIPYSVRLFAKKCFWKIKHVQNKPTVSIQIDDISQNQMNANSLEKMRDMIKEAKSESDYVVVLPHMGGQFNLKIGSCSKFLSDFFIESGADLVIANHPHIVQTSKKYSDNKYSFYSLGGISISPSADYLVKETLPEYSVIVHCYYRREKIKLTFSICKAVESKNGLLKVYPINKLYQILKDTEQRQQLLKETTMIYNRFMGTDLTNVDIKDEYVIN